MNTSTARDLAKMSRKRLPVWRSSMSVEFQFENHPIKVSFEHNLFSEVFLLIPTEVTGIISWSVFSISRKERWFL